MSEATEHLGSPLAPWKWAALTAVGVVLLRVLVILCELQR